MYFSTENNALSDSIQMFSAYYIYVCEIVLVFYWWRWSTFVTLLLFSEVGMSLFAAWQSVFTQWRWQWTSV